MTHIHTPIPLPSKSQIAGVIGAAVSATVTLAAHVPQIEAITGPLPPKARIALQLVGLAVALLGRSPAPALSGLPPRKDPETV